MRTFRTMKLLCSSYKGYPVLKVDDLFIVLVISHKIITREYLQRPLKGYTKTMLTDGN